jgi:hypothetical protein
MQMAKRRMAGQSPGPVASAGRVGGANQKKSRRRGLGTRRRAHGRSKSRCEGMIMYGDRARGDAVSGLGLPGCAS